jgi:hypothetical protein
MTTLTKRYLRAIEHYQAAREAQRALHNHVEEHNLVSLDEEVEFAAEYVNGAWQEVERLHPVVLLERMVR